MGCVTGSVVSCIKGDEAMQQLQRCTIWSKFGVPDIQGTHFDTLIDDFATTGFADTKAFAVRHHDSGFLDWG